MGKQVIWTLAEAQNFCYFLSVVLKPNGYGVGLTGSVLTNFESLNDLDLIIYPLIKSDSLPHSPFEHLKTELEKFGMTRILTSEEVTKHWRTKGSIDEKLVEIWKYGKKRIDIFLLK